VKAIAVTQRVEVVPAYNERRDCLDQAWSKFLAECGVLAVPVPNVVEVALGLCEKANVSGLLLTGGNDLALLGGDAPERDAVENALLEFAHGHGLPVLGVCRGMQLIQHRFGVPMCRVEGHVAQKQVIRIHDQPREVNSYHRFGASESREPLETWAVAEDGVVKAIRHRTEPMTGIMWHPERIAPFSAADVQLVRRIFGVEECAL
jgi:N5-(cytidine 5'-diphosphoramidyl)-L-glutamine hydrolase